jgi:hypothetical protein
VLADDSQSVFGHCLRAALIVCADAAAARSSLAASVAIIEAACPDVHDPARGHASAARAWLEGDPALAVERYGAIVTDRPRDILALVVAHTLDFHLGQRRMMRVRLARVLPKWDAAMPGYASVLAMYAFALEENGQYRRAEKIARRALVLDPRHPGAIHVIAHVMEMKGRAREGLAFLAATESAWIEGTGFSVHLAWHRDSFILIRTIWSPRSPPMMRRLRMRAPQAYPCLPMLRRSFGVCNSETSTWTGGGNYWPIAGRRGRWPVRGRSTSCTP